MEHAFVVEAHNIKFILVLLKMTPLVRVIKCVKKIVLVAHNLEVISIIILINLNQ